LQELEADLVDATVILGLVTLDVGGLLAVNNRLLVSRRALLDANTILEKLESGANVHGLDSRY